MADETKERILDAAERLFGERGYDAASLRTITAEAGVNIAAVNYHFKSKEELLRAVLTRRLHPVNEKRLGLLDACEAKWKDSPPRLDELVRILLEPLMAMGGEHGQESVGFKMLFGRMYSEPSVNNIHRIFHEEMREPIKRFVAAFQRALPWIPPVELYWRIHFIIGATAHTLAGATIVQTISGGLCDPGDAKGVTERLVAFVLGGLQAQLPAGVSKAAPSTPGIQLPGRINRSRGGKKRDFARPAEQAV